MFQPHEYRRWVQTHDLVAYTVQIKETDLYIRTSTDLSAKAYALTKKHRDALEGYIRSHPFFSASFNPLTVENEAPPIVREMASASGLAGVGPMAAVAGAMAQMVGKELAFLSKEVIIENGGDIYILSARNRAVSIFAGGSPLSGEIGLLIRAEETPLGICTSSGTVGPSISLGKADAAVVVAKSAALADAAATTIGNAVLATEDIPRAFELAKSINGLMGVVIIKDDKIGVWGKLEICHTNSKPDENPG